MTELPGKRRRYVFLRYVLKKVAIFFVVLFASFSVVFFFMRLIPGDPVTKFVRMMEQRYSWSPLSLEIVDHYKKLFGLEGDLLTQYVSYLQRLFLHFDLGPSFVSFPTPVLDLIVSKLPWSIALLGLATLISWTIGVLAGTLVGWKKGTKFDSVIFSIALCMSQIPVYIVLLFMVLLLSYVFAVFPSRFAYSPGVTPGFDLTFIVSVLYHAQLPALSLILVQVSGWLLGSRAITVTILGEDYLLFAQTKGLKTTKLLSRYVLRNALLPQVTALAMGLGFSVNGFYLVEFLFNYPGIGGLLYNAVYTQDYNTVQGIILISIFTVLLANLIIDVLYPLIDPRIRRG